MSQMSDAFWHKGQHEMVGTRAFSTGTWAMHASNKENLKTTTAINYSLSSTGGIYAVAATGEFDVSALTAGANATVTVTDDSSPTTRTVRQNAVGLSVPAGSHCYIIGAFNAAGALKVYAGEVVVGTGTAGTTGTAARRPELDCSAECPVFERYLANDASTGSAVAFGTQLLDATGMTATFTNLSFIPNNTDSAGSAQ